MFRLFYRDIQGRIFYRAEETPVLDCWQPFRSKAYEYSGNHVIDLLKSFHKDLKPGEALGIERV